MAVRCSLLRHAVGSAGASELCVGVTVSCLSCSSRSQPLSGDHFGGVIVIARSATAYSVELSAAIRRKERLSLPESEETRMNEAHGPNTRRLLTGLTVAHCHLHLVHRTLPCRPFTRQLHAVVRARPLSMS